MDWIIQIITRDFMLYSCHNINLRQERLWVFFISIKKKKLDSYVFLIWVWGHQNFHLRWLPPSWSVSDVLWWFTVNATPQVTRCLSFHLLQTWSKDTQDVSDWFTERERFTKKSQPSQVIHTKLKSRTHLKLKHWNQVYGK